MGWFSFRNGHATAGDLLTRDLIAAWLREAGCDCDVANAPPFAGGVDWRKTKASRYSHVVFVCGPFQDGELEQEMRRHFAGVPLIGMNLSMVQPLQSYNPFAHLFERDSTRAARPDLVFATREKRVPVVGCCLVEPYDAGRTEITDPAIDRLLARQEAAIVRIDTRLDENAVGLRTPREVESLIAKMDVVVTTRLHGTVLALKNGVPALAIDPEMGGFKIVRQAGLIGWPVAFAVDQISDKALAEAFAYCLTEEARELARACAARACEQLEATRSEFVALMREGAGS